MLGKDRVDPSRAADASEHKALADVEACGIHILNVFDSEGLAPDFSYTMGLWHTHGHPEVLILGLKDDLCARLLNNINFEIGNGATFRSGCSSTAVIEDFRCYFETLPREHYSEYLGWNRWFYGEDEFEAVQMLWPNVSGVYPWQAAASEYLRWSEPVLTRVPELFT